MTYKEEESSGAAFDKFMETFFMDPNTTYLDFSTFRVDLYECPSGYIAEAILEDIPFSRILTTANDCDLTISIDHRNGSTLTRSVSFPFKLESRKLRAELLQDILQVTISKEILPNVSKPWSAEFIP